jgi:hypothetical protein
MSKKKTNVYVESQDIASNSCVKVLFGEFTQEEINKFFQKLRSTPYPHIGCITEFKVSQTKVSIFNFLIPNRARNNELHIELTPNTIHSECACLSATTCPQCIFDRKCKNDYVIGLIGKSFVTPDYSK